MEARTHPNPTQLARGVWLAPQLILALVLLLQLLSSLALNHGALYFSLDDPYIHLALAENLFRGHFGLNPSEVSAPSSSILWPFLLTPLTAFEHPDRILLALNACLASATLWLVLAALGQSLTPGSDPRLQGAIGLFGVLAIPALNLVGLVFTGMEHSLQVFLAVALVHGVLTTLRQRTVPRWLLAAIVLGPLVRYENAALSAAALLWLWLRAERPGERRSALFTGSILALALASYSWLLHSLGLYPLPTSVLVKSAAAAPDGGLRPVLYGLYHNVSSTPGVLMSLAVLALLGAAMSDSRPRAERQFALCFAGGLALHILIGRFGWYNRYEIYAWAACWLVCIYVWREPLAALLSRTSLVRSAVFGVLIVGVTCREYVIGLANNPQATHNVYLQQAQLGRFAREIHRAPVAVNDLGLVAWRNSHYVLDLWGLASLEALRARGRSPEDSAWMGPLAREHDVGVAMIYDKWFPGLPEEWVRLGELHMAGIRVTPADNVVAFFATDAARVPALLQELRDFEAGLPEGASFVFAR